MQTCVANRVALPARARWVWYLPSALLIGVACTQIWLTHTAALSPWLGGGFGMFSTTDVGRNRHLHAWAIRPGIRRELPIPGALRDLARRVLVLPTDANLRALASELSDLPTPDAGPLEAVAIQVWTTHFAPDSLQPSGAILRALEVPIGQP